MKSPNGAQQLLMALGFDSFKVMLGHKVGKQTHHTKKGPGRKCARKAKVVK